MTLKGRQMKGFEVRTIAKCELFEYKMWSSEYRVPHHVWLMLLFSLEKRHITWSIQVCLPTSSINSPIIRIIYCNQRWAVLKPRMLQHVRCRRTVWWAILRHWCKQITKRIQTRLGIPILSRLCTVDGTMQMIENATFPRGSCCQTLASAQDHGQSLRVKPRVDLIEKGINMY